MYHAGLRVLAAVLVSLSGDDGLSHSSKSIPNLLNLARKSALNFCGDGSRIRTRRRLDLLFKALGNTK